MKHLSFLMAALLGAALSTSALAQTVAVSHAWARATVQGQMATGAFMTLTSSSDVRLVAVSTPVAGAAEVHAMKMDGNVMTMQPVEGGLELPAGKPVELKSGGYHLMLMDLKLALQKDTSIPLTLVLRDRKGVETRQQVRVPVAVAPPAH